MTGFRVALNHEHLKGVKAFVEGDKLNTLTFVGVVALAGASLLVAPAAHATSCGSTSKTSEDIAAGCDAPEGTEVLVDGVSFIVPPVNTGVASSSITAADAAEVPDINLVNSSAGVAIRVGDTWTGTDRSVAASKSLTSGGAEYADADTAAGSGGGQTPAGDAPSGTDSPTGGCNASYKLLNYNFGTQSVNWYYNDNASRATYAYDVLRRAANTWTGTLRACGTTVISGAHNAALGSTTAQARVGADSGCGSDDRKNVISWGVLRNGILATTCTWYNRYGDALGSDQRYGSNYNWSSTSSCSGARYDMQGIATHEWGHTYGLDHVKQETGLVMKPYSSTCQTSQRTLGLGDIKGIQRIFS